MTQADFKKVARRLVIELAVAVALVSYSINFAKGESYSENWKFVFTHPLILLHVGVSTVILIEAVILLVRSLRSRRRSWAMWSLIGLAFVIAAYIAGELYVKTLSSTAIDDMGNAGAGAIVTYGLAWYFNRKRKVHHQ